jgi:hypothetical protein
MKPVKHIFTVKDEDDNGQIYQIESTIDKDGTITIHKVFILVISNGVTTTMMLNMNAIIYEIKINPIQIIDKHIQDICDQEFNELLNDVNNRNKKVYESDNNIKDVKDLTVEEMMIALEQANLHQMSYEDVIANIEDGTSKK